MINNQEKLTKRSIYVEDEVEYWRARFANLKEKLPHQWQKKLRMCTPEYKDSEWVLTIQAVSRNRASMPKTKSVVLNLEAMLAKDKKSTSIYKKWQTKNLKAS